MPQTESFTSNPVNPKHVHAILKARLSNITAGARAASACRRSEG